MATAGDAPSWMSLLGPGWEKYLNPSTYARQQSNSQFNPVLKGLDLQRSRASLLKGQSNAAIQSAMAPALEAYKNMGTQNANTTANAAHGIQGMAQQLAGGLGSSGNNAGLGNTAANYGGLVQAQGAVQGRADAQGLTSAQQRVAQMQATRQSELTNKMMDIDKAMVDAKRAKADTYTKAFTEGLGMKQQMIAAALANRGSIINQDVLQAMAPEQLKGAKLANKQAEQNLVWQNLQGQQGMEMNALQMKALKAQMAASGVNTKSFFGNEPQTQQAALDGIMQQFIDPTSGGWRGGFDANKVIKAMYTKMAILFPGTAKNPKGANKMGKAISDWVHSYNGMNTGSGPADPGLGGSYSTAPTGGSGGGSNGNYPSIWDNVP